MIYIYYNSLYHNALSEVTKVHDHILRELGIGALGNLAIFYRNSFLTITHGGISSNVIVIKNGVILNGTRVHHPGMGNKLFI